MGCPKKHVNSEGVLNRRRRFGNMNYDHVLSPKIVQVEVIRRLTLEHAKKALITHEEADSASDPLTDPVSEYSLTRTCWRYM